MSITVFVSPNTKTGTTTIANYTALQIARNTKEMVLLIEFSRFTGRSIYINRQVAEKRRSLKNVVLNPEDFSVLQENVMTSSLASNLCFLSMNLYEDFLELKTYTSTALTRVVSNAKNYFQHIIIDLPSNFEEPVVGATLGESFDHKINNIFMVLDEDALTFKLLYDFSAVLRLGNAKPLYVTYIFNKTTKHYVDFIEKNLELPLIKPLNMIKMRQVDDMVDCCNRGTPYDIGSGRAAKSFLTGITTITKIALSGQRGTDPITGIGVKAVKRRDKDYEITPSSEGTENTENKSNSKKGFALFKNKNQKNTPSTTSQQDNQEVFIEEEIFGDIQPQSQQYQEPPQPQPQQQQQYQQEPQQQQSQSSLNFQFKASQEQNAGTSNDDWLEEEEFQPTTTSLKQDEGLDFDL